LTALQGGDQRWLIDHATARHVNQISARFHGSQRHGINQVGGRRGKGAGERNIVGAGQEFQQTVGGVGFINIGIDRGQIALCPDHLHVKGFG
jgi:hypothetical protein